MIFITKTFFCFKRLFFIFTTVLFLFTHANAALKVKRLSSLKYSEKEATEKTRKTYKCLRNYFQTPEYPFFKISSTESLLAENGDLIATNLKIWSDNKRPEAFETIATKFIKSMVQIHNYTSVEKANILLNRDRNLDPLRVSYFEVETETGEHSGFRVFDASHELRDTLGEIIETSNEKITTPIESTIAELPPKWNHSNRRYMWEIGLVHNHPKLQETGSLLFSLAAIELDLRYNNSEFMRGKTSLLEERNFSVLIQTRKETINYFENFGFNLESEIPLSSGLYLMSVSGTKFLETNFYGRVMIGQKGEKRKYTIDKLNKHIEDGRKRLNSVLSNPKIPLNNLSEIKLAANYIMNKLELIRQNKDPKDQHQLIVEFLNLYLIVMNSIPEKYKGPLWKPLFNYLESAYYTTSSLEALLTWLHYYNKLLYKIDTPIDLNSEISKIAFPNKISLGE